MKFWLTVIVGVAVVTGGPTALIVMTPTSQPIPSATPTAAPATPKEAKFDPEKHPIAVVDGPIEFSEDNLGQNQKGQNLFKVRNDGKVDLVLTPKRATCQCTHLWIADIAPKPEEEAPKLLLERAEFIVKPGQTVYVVARWDTKDKLGTQNVGIPVGTNDPRKYELAFRVNFNIHREIVPSSDHIVWGMVDEGRKKSATATITSLLRDKFDVAKIDVSSEGFSAKAVPMTAEELKETTAKSGYTIVVENTGKNAVGAVDEKIVVYVKTPRSDEPIQFRVIGRVMGDIETDLGGVQIDLKHVNAAANKPKTVRIFARTLPEGETLRVGNVKPPESLTVTLERDPRINVVWVMKVAVKPDAPAGNIEDGKIAIVDSTGRERLVFRVMGMVNSGVARQAAVR